MIEFISVRPSDYLFDISVSTSTHSNKEDFSNASASMKYTRQSVNIDTMCQLIRKGHAFCHCYDDHGKTFGNSVKTTGNFRYTSIIPYDIDDNALPMEDFIATLTYQPTIAYTTASDGIKGNRCRLVYVFDSTIEGNINYQHIYDTLQAESHIGELKDRCTRSTAQPIFGNALPSCRMVCNNIVYSLPETAAGGREVSPQNKTKKRESIIILDDTLKNDFINMSLWKFLNKYEAYYQPVEESELVYQNGYADIDENYYRLYRKWTVDYSDNGRPYRRIHKWQDGEGRRKKLFVASMVIRKIKPDITAEHLVFCLAHEVRYYYSNIDDVLCPKFILQLVESTMRKPIEEITLKCHDTRKFCIDKDYWSERGVSPQAAIQKVRGRRTSERIGELYDYSLSDKENIQLMAEYGLSISPSTLKRWRKTHGIIRQKKGGGYIRENTGTSLQVNLSRPEQATGYVEQNNNNLKTDKE